MLKGLSFKRSLVRIRRIKLNQNIFIFGFFLFLSAVFWFFNALSREYYTDLMVPVKFINLPDNKLQVGNTSEFIKVKVSAFGYQVMDYKASTISPIIIDLKQYNLQLVQGSKSRKYFIPTSNFTHLITSVLGNEFKINAISPDSLVIELVKVISKKVPVKGNLSLEFRKQYMQQDSILFQPDSVKIKGIESVLDSIDAVFTTYEKIEDIHDSLRFEIPLQKIRGTELSANSAICLIPAEEYTELELKLPVYTQNEPIGYVLKLFPSEVRVLFNVGFSQYRSITAEQFRIVADYEGVEKSGNSKVAIRMIKMPQHISNIRIFPSSLDYIIEKND